jgi:DNA modification methylase
MIELNKIYCESNLETMSRMPDNFIDLTVTSPPYDNLRNYNGYDFDFESIAKELFRVTKKGGVVVWVVGDATINGSETGTSFKQVLYFKEIGFNLWDTMIYEKNNYMPLNHNRYEQAFEFMFLLSKGIPKTFNAIKEKTIGRQFRKPEKVRGAGADPLSKTAKRSKLKPQWTKEDKIIGNIWSYNVGIGQSSKDDEAFNHPAIFPENMVIDHIISWSNESDLIYDPFTGSGTTAKMAHLLKRNWIGSEISAEYVKIAEKRIAPYLAQQTINFSPNPCN